MCFIIVLQNYAIFRQIVKDVFSGLPDAPPGPNLALASNTTRSPLDVESALESTAIDGGLVPHKAWRDKCMQLYSIAQVHQGEASPLHSMQRRMVR